MIFYGGLFEIHDFAEKIGKNRNFKLDDDIMTSHTAYFEMNVCADYS